METAFTENYGVDFSVLTDAFECKKSFKHFVKTFWKEAISTDVVWNWHMDEICDVVEVNDKRLFKGLPKLNDVIINVPPGTSKTMLVSILATCWDFANKPSIRIGIGSHSDKVILGISDKISLVMNSDKYKSYFPDVKIRQDLNNKHNFKTESQGELWVFTTKSDITGLHFDKINLDDIINPKGVKSDVEIYNVNTTFLSETISNRKTDPDITLTYLTMQRLSMKDPTAFLLDLEPDTLHVCIPATDEYTIKPSHLRSNYVDGLLDPKRLSRKVLAQKRKRMTEKIFQAQYGQAPVPLGGNTIKTDWIKQVDYDDIPREVWNQPTDMIIDTAMTNDKTNDPSGILCCVYHDNILYLLNFWTDWLKQNDLVKKIAELGDDWCDKKSRIMIEKKANGHATIDELARIYHNKYNVIGLDKSVGKQAMLDAYAASIESGKVVMLRGSWNADFRDDNVIKVNLIKVKTLSCLTHACKHYFTIVSSGRYTAMA